MRSLDLLGVAAQAETLRWRREAAGAARRLAFVAAACAFGAAAVVLLHVAGWIALSEEYGRLVAALALAGIDAVLAMLMLLFTRRRTDAVAAEALHVRQLALLQLSQRSFVQEGLSLLGWRVPAVAAGGILVEQILKALRR
ncbi:hypothetical protein ACQW02_02260 [Humitalea sp. 24SJ18S-53]|uniref:hypothetical protein n=1 Tax=Humitalea sp. 24SJ18S-53 TaxID=3422307 RepID=UPI003D666D25